MTWVVEPEKEDDNGTETVWWCGWALFTGLVTAVAWVADHSNVCAPTFCVINAD